MTVHIERGRPCRLAHMTLLCVLISLTLPLILFPRRMPRPAKKAILPFDDYFRAMNGELELYGSSVYPETVAVQRAIRKHQSPADCADAKYLVFELWNHGLGSVYLGASAALALAISSNRVLLLAEPGGRFGWMAAQGCVKSGPECFFKPVSSCNLQKIRFANYTKRVINAAEGYLSPDDPTSVLYIPTGKPYLRPVRRNISTILTTVYKHLGLSPVDHSPDALGAYRISRQWHTQASLYLLRLNDRMQALAKSGLQGCVDRGTSHALRSRTIGVPLRGSDKCKPAHGGEMRCVDVQSVVDTLVRIRIAQPWINGALITSEDSALSRRVSRKLKKDWILRYNLRDVQQGSGSPWVLVNGHDPAYLATESMLVTLVCQIMPKYHVLTIRSNYHSLIDMLAKVVPGKPAHFSYSIGDIYYPV